MTLTGLIDQMRLLPSFKLGVDHRFLWLRVMVLAAGCDPGIRGTFMAARANSAYRPFPGRRSTLQHCTSPVHSPALKMVPWGFRLDTQSSSAYFIARKRWHGIEMVPPPAHQIRVSCLDWSSRVEDGLGGIERVPGYSPPESHARIIALLLGPVLAGLTLREDVHSLLVK